MRLAILANLLILAGCANANMGTTIKTTNAPKGYQIFCLMHGECDGRDHAPMRVEADLNLISTLESVQRLVNVQIIPKDNPKGLWEYPVDHMGDCNTYVLAKRKMLIERGVPASSLLMTVVRTETGQGHLVLTVVTTDGDLVLDNRMPTVLPWRSLPYTWIKRQSAKNETEWVSVNQPL